MRSRYCAYVRQDRDYLLKTWDELTRPVDIDMPSGDRVKWLGLTIVATQAGGTADVAGMVEFDARYKINGKACRLHERSSFRRIADRWFYVDGIIE